MCRLRLAGLVCGAVLAAAPEAWAASAAVLLEKGVFQEETVGDLEAAIKVYEQIVADDRANRRYVAEAQYRLGACYLKKGETAKATAALMRVAADFPDQEAVVASARKALASVRKRVSGAEAAALVGRAVTVISTCSEADPRVKTSLQTLEGLDDETVAKLLAGYLGRNEPTIRRSAVYILWRRPSRTIAPAVAGLTKLCDHDEDITRGMAAIALGAHKIANVFDRVSRMATADSSAYARRCAAYALGLMGDPKAKAVLEKTAADPDAFVAKNAKAALAMLSAAAPATRPARPFPELVGCRLKQTLHLEIDKRWPEFHLHAPVTVEAQTHLIVTWRVAPELASQVKSLAVIVQQPAEANPKDEKSVAWLAVNLPPSVRSVVVGSKTGIEPSGGGPLEPGSYRVTVCAYDKVKQSSDWSGLLGAAIQVLTVKPLMRTQIMVEDVQPDGSIRFVSVQQRRHTGSAPLTTRGFRNSDFVHVTAMADAKGRPIRFATTHRGDMFMYRATLNEPVPPGGALLMSTEGTMKGKIKPVEGSPGEFLYHMRHWPGGREATRRIEVFRLPKGAKLLDVTPAKTARRTRDGRIELAVEDVIPPGGSLTTTFRYQLPEAKSK